MNIQKKLQTTIDNIKSRCRNPNNDHFSAYGGRGIQCHWNNIAEFKADMLDSLLDAIKKYPNERLSIDRIDVDGDYCKENCQWIPIGVNSSKDNKGKSKSAAHKLSMSLERKGKPQTSARKAVLDRVHENSKKRIVMLLGGEEVCCFKSIIDGASFIGAPASNVHEIVARKGYRKTCKGYGFNYLPNS